MANQFLTSGGLVEGPPLTQEVEAPPMPDADVFPRWMYPSGGPTEPDYGGREFASAEELKAAEGQWFPTPQAAQEAAAKPATPKVPAPDEEEEAPTRRSHR
jgi:hypothetical protein